MATAPFGFLRVAAACPPVRVADPERNADATLHFVARATERGAQVLVLPELGLTGYTCGDLFFSLTTLVTGAERALERVLRETARRPTVVVVGLPVPGRAAVQRGRRAAGGPGSRGGAQDLPARLQGVLRGALVLFRARGPRGGGPPGRPAGPLRHGPPVPAARGPRCHPRRRDLRGPVGAHTAEARGTRWRAPPSSSSSASNDVVAKAEYRRELVRQQSGRTLAAYAYANAGVHESTDRPRLRGAPADRGERRPPRGGRALPARRRPRGHRRGRRAPGGGSSAPGRPRSPTPSTARARPTGRSPWPPCPHRCHRARPPRGPPPCPLRVTPPPWTSGAARSSRSRPPASPEGSSTWGRSGPSSASPAGSTPRSPSSCACGRSTCSPFPAPASSP